MAVSPDAREAVLALLDERGPGKTICPSEAARRMAKPGTDWRAQMQDIHEAVDMLHRERRIELSWKGEQLDRRRGAYRIARRREATMEPKGS
jgi:hypothetical protein